MAEEEREATEVDEAMKVAKAALGEGVDLELVQEEPAEPAEPAVDDQAEGQEEGEPEESQPEEKAPSKPLAAKAYKKRAQERARLEIEKERHRQELQAATQRNEEMRGYLNVLLRQLASGQNGQAEKEPEFPGVDPETQALIRHEMDRVMKGVEGTVKPLIQDKELSDKERERKQLEDRSREMWGNFASTLQKEEEEYRGSELGQGYDERASGYQKSFRGMLESLREEYPHIEERTIAELERANLLGMAQIARSLKVPIPYFADAYFRSMGHPPAQEVEPAESEPSADLRLAQQAVNDGVASSPGGHRTGPGDPLDVDVLIEQGLSPEGMEKLIGSGDDWVDKLVNLGMQAQRRAEET